MDKSKGLLRIVMDCVISFAAYTVPTIGLTFVIQPLMARELTAADYGFFLTIISAIRLCVNIGAATLANTRLLVHRQYEDAKVIGDFNILFAAACACSSIVVMVIMLLSQQNALDVLLSVLVLVLIMMHDYVAVEYRLSLNFKLTLWDNILTVLGYLLGYVVFRFTKMWQAVFLGGYLISLVFVFRTTTIWKEPWTRTERMSSTFGKYRQLMMSSALTDSINYFDKLLIYPVLGGMVVSAYNAAAVMGKAVQLVSVPVQRVLLSYIVKAKRMHRKTLMVILLLSASAFVAAYFVLIQLSLVLIPYMYPQYAEAAFEILPVVMSGIIINTYAGMINIIVMRFDKTGYQVIISGARILVYLLISLVFLPLYGIRAFCYGVLISSVVRLLLVLLRLFAGTRKTKRPR